MSEKQIPSRKLPLVRLCGCYFRCWATCVNMHSWLTCGLDRHTIVGLNKARRSLDRYMLCWTVVLIICLILLFLFPQYLWPMVVVPVWRLYEITGIMLYDTVRMVRRPFTHEFGRFIYGSSRWLLLTLFTVLQIVLAFAIVFLALGHRFEPAIEHPVVALYQSLLTFTTLGYGDIRPAASDLLVRGLVCWELALFIITVVVRLPITLSTIQYEDVEKDVHKQTE